ncbi:unnamed protein product, partial [Darwinula stevensoni]
MKIGVPAETAHGETRVAATPETVKKLIAQGHEVLVQSGAGVKASCPDHAYEAVGAILCDAKQALQAELVLKVRGPNEEERSMMQGQSTLVGMLDPFDKKGLEELAKIGLTAYALEAAPRTTRAQALDVLSSQANVAGYKAVMIAADNYQRLFPMMMTAAGTIKAARVVVLGVGVAGLQAIATAKRLGAVIEASDVRPSVQEQVHSLGAKFIEVPYETDEEREAAQGVGGYAKPMPLSWLERQKEEVAKRVAAADIVISTALIPGRAAPQLITAEMVASMKPGSVIVDIAAGRGPNGIDGNCPLTEAGKTVVKHGVTIVGQTNLPALVAADASALYARNVVDFLKLIIYSDGENKGQLHVNLQDDIVAACLVTRDYQVIWNVTPALHTPLMALTNAISAIVIVGGMLATALTQIPAATVMGTLAVALAAVNVFGGFLVTKRMLEMFKKKDKSTKKDQNKPAALKGLSHPTTSIRGNIFGMVGMAIAIVTTFVLIFKMADEMHVTLGASLGYVLGALAIGGGIGAYMAHKVEMTKMPELVAFMHSMIGLSAVCIAVAVAIEPWAFGIAAHAPLSIPAGNRVELALGAFIGAVTFSGSVIAFGKLSGKYKFRLFQGTPVTFKGQHILNAILGLAVAFFVFGFWHSQSMMDFYIVVALGFLLGVLLIIPIGGADMPVVVSMLNSYSGWAAAGIGFSLNNSMLIIAGSLVGSSGAILSYIMCKAMNRSFFNVILGGFGGESDGAATGDGQKRNVKTGSADDVAFILSNAESVIIVPGYGLAVARAQHAVKELAQLLREK